MIIRDRNNAVYKRVGYYFGGNNFMTPLTVGYTEVELESGKRLFELSRARDGGSWFGGATMYGVTVKDLVDGELVDRFDLSQACFGLESAEEYIEKIGRDHC